MARQETGRVRTIEEFKKKKFRYQCSPYTVEIEHMVKSLENMGGHSVNHLRKHYLVVYMNLLIRYMN